MRRAVLFALAVLLAAPGAAKAADLPARAPAPVVVAPGPAIPQCDNPRILARIMERFAWAEENTWRRGFVMARLERPQNRDNVFYGPSLIRHRHCQAEALMTNHMRRTVYYTIEEQMGFASIGSGVDFCVLGLDPWYVHGAACRSVR